MALPFSVDFLLKKACVGRHPILLHCGAALQPRARCAPGDAGQSRAALLGNEAAPVRPTARLKQDAVMAMLLLCTNII